MQLRITSAFQRMTVLATDGRLPYPYGHELAGHEVSNLAATIAKAESAGANVLAGPYSADGRQAKMLEVSGRLYCRSTRHHAVIPRRPWEGSTAVLRRLGNHFGELSRRSVASLSNPGHR